MATKKPSKSAEKVSKRDLYVRSEVRFATRADLDQVKNYATIHGFKSFNECIVSILHCATVPEVSVARDAADYAKLLAAARVTQAARAAKIRAAKAHKRD